jgi:hypothetical protein
MFMAIPYYVYLVLKMPGLHGIISIRGDIKRAFDCDREMSYPVFMPKPSAHRMYAHDQLFHTYRQKVFTDNQMS